MSDEQSPLKLALRREGKAWRRQILMSLEQLKEAGSDEKPDLDFRRRQFERRIQIFKKEGRIER